MSTHVHVQKTKTQREKETANHRWRWIWSVAAAFISRYSKHSDRFYLCNAYEAMISAFQQKHVITFHLKLFHVLFFAVDVITCSRCSSRQAKGTTLLSCTLEVNPVMRRHLNSPLCLAPGSPQWGSRRTAVCKSRLPKIAASCQCATKAGTSAMRTRPVPSWDSESTGSPLFIILLKLKNTQASIRNPKYPSSVLHQHLLSFPTIIQSWTDCSRMQTHTCFHCPPAVSTILKHGLASGLSAPGLAELSTAHTGPSSNEDVFPFYFCLVMTKGLCLWEFISLTLCPFPQGLPQQCSSISGVLKLDTDGQIIFVYPGSGKRQVYGVVLMSLSSREISHSLW